MRQFHVAQDSSEATQDYYLGKFIGNSWLVAGEDAFRGPQMLLKQLVSEGSACTDAGKIGKPRRVEIEFRCSHTNEEKILYVREAATCLYEMAIATRKLCGNPAFSGEAFKTQSTLTCYTLSKTAPSPSLPPPPPPPPLKPTTLEEENKKILKKMLSDIFGVL